MYKLSDTIERKFVDSIDISEWEIESDSGWVDIEAINKTVEYDVWYLETESGIVLECADKHILFTENNEEIFAESLKIGDKIAGQYGVTETVSKIYKTELKDNMYDLSVGGDHTFYANGLKHHNTTTTAAFVLYQILFNKNYKVALLANKAETACEILFRIKEMYEGLPVWLQKGVKRWNVKDILLDNGSKVFCGATTKGGIRGKTISLLVLDEAAIIPNNIADAFLAATLPTISSGKKTKVVIISTPLGFNHFWKLWNDAEKGRGIFKPIRIRWNEHPDHDQNWADEQLRMLGPVKYAQEIDCEFQGSSFTLINSPTLARLTYSDPIFEDGTTKVFAHPEENHQYLIICDPSEGVMLDYTAVTIIDITKNPYQIVLTYRCNTMSPELMPDFLYTLGMKYNEAYVLCEINKFSDIPYNLYMDFEYPNVIQLASDKKGDQEVSNGFGNARIRYGITMDRKVKNLGCSSIKQIVENDILILHDSEIIHEFSVFIRNKTSFAADEGYNDDLVMTLVIFGWTVKQDFFKAIVADSNRSSLYKNRISEVTEHLCNVFRVDGTEGNTDENGIIWETVNVQY